MKRSNVSIWVGSLLGVEKEWWDESDKGLFYDNGEMVIVSKPLLPKPTLKPVAPNSYSYREVIKSINAI